ncbi:MAG: response regulator [Pseudomonadota bacterium]
MQIGVDSKRAVENKRVFVVDANDISATALQFMLADEMETHVYETGAAALERAAAFPPQLVLLAQNILESDGVGIIARLRAAIDGVKILLVCSDAAHPLIVEALSLGASSTLLRPLKLETVRRKVDGQLGRLPQLNIPVVRR